MPLFILSKNREGMGRGGGEAGGGGIFCGGVFVRFMSGRRFFLFFRFFTFYLVLAAVVICVRIYPTIYSFLFFIF